ncbi:hypothetical protein AX16_005809 [Volvariella volvacea WC 439]|nr:hypothetical protein AX16_005809 [Volvariella volvacea WC 439]
MTKWVFLYRDMSRFSTVIADDRDRNRAEQFSAALFNISDVLGELVLLYRCWTIWHRNPYILFVIGTVWLAFLGVVIVTMYFLLQSSSLIAPESLLPLGTAAFALPLVFNVLVSFLVVGRLWYFGQRQKTSSTSREAFASLHQSLQRHLHNAMLITIEAGLLYFLVQAVLTGLYVSGHPAQLMWSHITAQIYGIAPTLIFVRVGLGHSIQLAGAESDQHLSESVRSVRHHPGHTRNPSSQHQLAPITITRTVLVEPSDSTDGGHEVIPIRDLERGQHKPGGFEYQRSKWKSFISIDRESQN